ncbi:hypothetical protein SELMODRAFT_403833 [Selaginella moellendorffii]|uniref:Protein kinase domain-containing protein n=1 Tax=Selaginella moellendorffii TaxID=88036 RepID=D8QSP4_SELML|nr:hypothetical protein SELMODRAFT_403833 [Selaginella moellendorffii]
MGYSVKEELYELLKLPLPQEQERESTESKRLMDEQRALVRSMEAMEFNQASIRDLFSVEKELGRGGHCVQSETVLTKLSKSKERSGVVQLVDVFKDEDHYFLLMDQCQCSLTEVLLKKKKLSEHEAAVVIKNVARTVGKMHDMGMAHRDIKTDNRGPGIKFRMSNLAGTQMYSAPEMVNSDEYDEMVDVWGMGIVLYEILSGTIALCMGREDVPLSSLDWTDVTEEAKDLILQLLHLNPRKRLPIHEIEKHPWVVKHSARQQKLSNLVEGGGEPNLETKKMVLEPSLKRRRGDQEEAEQSLMAKKAQTVESSNY